MFVKRSSDQDHTVGLRAFGEKMRRRAGNRFRSLEIFFAFDLREITLREEFLQTDDVGALLRGSLDEFRGPAEIALDVLADFRLDQADSDGVFSHIRITVSARLFRTPRAP